MKSKETDVGCGLSKKQLSIYVHIPFCINKCKYCDFLSFPSDETIKEQYIDALLLEIKHWGAELKEQYLSIRSVYIGGGTPSILKPELIQKILGQIQESFSDLSEAEISIEVNPGTLTKEKASKYRSAGVNRLSIGLQSASDQDLKILGRVHNFSQFLTGYALAREVGFSNINIDLMSALPEQTVKEYEKGLLKVLKLKPDHISAYSLIIEEGTPFYKAYHNNSHLLPTEDEDRKMYEITKEILSANGFKRYEISNYAKPFYECRHNQVYWARGEYLGVGLGSSSFLSHIRYKNTDNITDYMQNKEKRVEEILLTKEDEMAEFMFLGLRQCEGIAKSKFKKEFSVSVEEQFAQTINKYKELGLLCTDAERIWLTDQGIDVSNIVFTDFLL